MSIIQEKQNKSKKIKDKANDWSNEPLFGRLFETEEDNTWFNKSCQFARDNNYLDMLKKVYESNKNDEKEIPDELKKDIINGDIFNKSDVDLIKYFFEKDVTPVNGTYVSLIKGAYNTTNFDHLINKNPETIKCIATEIRNMDTDAIIKILSKPITPSRQLGSSFKNWCKDYFGKEKGFTVITDMDTLDNTKEDGKYIFCNTNDNELKIYAEKFNYTEKKGLDFLCKLIKDGKEHIVIGEAKMLSTQGGSQDRQLDDALRVTKIKDNKQLTGVSIIDGYVYMTNSENKCKQLQNRNVVSLFLLKDFINDVYSKL